jgi:parallel beta-helix repeat protein
VKNTVIENNVINNNATKSNIDIYDSNEVLLKANGIDVSGQNTEIRSNTITNFRNGIYLKNADTTNINKNTITRNNFGIEFDTNVRNTDIINNNIIKQLGWITFDMVEGPYGYGISVRHSGVNINILNNLINENYMGIFLDSKNSSGIVITGNEIKDSVIEGFTANENYTPATGATLVVENNALYNNAKGPSLMILGEVSANPAGIYGPGEWDDNLKLQLGPNWYGTTIYTKWGENNTGPGTICPRIKTTLIDCQLTSIGDGKYNVNFINDGEIVSELPDFTYYFTLNAYTDLQQEVIAYAHDGSATISFEKENFNSTGNIIEGSSGSLFDSERPFRITFTYNVPDSEIPK